MYVSAITGPPTQPLEAPIRDAYRSCSCSFPRSERMRGVAGCWEVARTCQCFNQDIQTALSDCMACGQAEYLNVLTPVADPLAELIQCYNSTEGLIPRLPYSHQGTLSERVCLGVSRRNLVAFLTPDYIFPPEV